MKWFLDTEFAENGSTIELISIGLVAEDGREYYAVSREFDLSKCNAWVTANVLPKLPPIDSPYWMTRAEIANDLRVGLLADGEPEIWGDQGGVGDCGSENRQGRVADESRPPQPEPPQGARPRAVDRAAIRDGRRHLRLLPPRRHGRRQLGVCRVLPRVRARARPSALHPNCGDDGADDRVADLAGDSTSAGGAAVNDEGEATEDYAAFTLADTALVAEGVTPIVDGRDARRRQGGAPVSDAAPTSIRDIVRRERWAKAIAEFAGHHPDWPCGDLIGYLLDGGGRLGSPVYEGTWTFMVDR